MQHCEECGKNPANVHLTQISADGTVITHLCEECARVKGISISVEGTQAPATEELPEAVDPGKTCESCGTTEAQFRERGRLGCNACYEMFSAEVDGMLKRMHGTDVHQGKRYSRIGAVRTSAADVERLRGELDEAIKNENFEEAARIRDTINALSTAE